MVNEDRHLRKRGRIWHFRRRIPESFRKIDDRDFHECTLNTNSILLARERRDALESADYNYWMALLEFEGGGVERSELWSLKRKIRQHYELACLRAVNLVLEKPSWQQLVRQKIWGESDQAADDGINGRSQPDSHRAANRMAALPRATISEAFEFYCEKIAICSLIRKSPMQRKRWRVAREYTIRNLIHIIGDKPIELIEREDGLAFYAWWVERMKPKVGRKTIGTNAANRDLGAMRVFYRDYFAHFGDDDRPNPFRNLSFKPICGQKPPVFENAWIRDVILKPGALAHINDEARAILFALIETGCRTSEVANLTAPDIILDTEVPYIRIRPKRRREIKNLQSIRDVPLVGVALEALKRHPEGFPRYRDKGERLSPYFLKSLRDYDLMPSPRHVVYSFRHSFEQRMLEAGLDYEVRCRLMGHSAGRPHYGDGGSISFRRDQLLKIAFPFNQELFV